MDPQQAHYQFRWLKVFRAHWACPFAICYLLFAIQPAASRYLSAIGYRPLLRTFLPLPALTAITAFPAFPYE
jgi:hypothetical protein